MARVAVLQVLRGVVGRRFTSCRCLSSCAGGSHSNIIRSSFPDVEIPDRTIPEYIFDAVASYHDKVALECFVSGRKYTYDDVRIKSTNFNRAIRKALKLKENDVVAVLLPNVPEFPIAVLGVLMAGLRLTTMNPIYTPAEIAKQLSDSDAKAIITLTELYPAVKLAFGPTTIPVITINDQPGSTTPEHALSFNELCDMKVDMPDVKAMKSTDCALLPYSSGTTGLPKGVQLSHRNIISNVEQFGSDNFNVLIRATDSHQDVLPAILPMFHIYGFTAITCAGLVAGAKIITMTRFLPDVYAKMLLDKKPTVLFIVPPIVIFLYSHPMITDKHLENVRVVVSGAAPLGALDEEKLKEKVGKSLTVIQGYGLTESSPVVTFTPHRQPRPGSTGMVMPNTEVKLMPMDDPNGEPLGPNQQGELWVRGPQVMLGYHNRSKETEETLVDGWLRTGDLFYYDEDKYFYVADRIKELIKVKGFQVPPAELEELIRDYPDVVDAAVIGVPHETYGEVPRAYVVIKKGAKFECDDLQEFISKKVAEYKRLRGGIGVLDAIPKNASGKILRRQLREQYLKEEGK